MTGNDIFSRAMLLLGYNDSNGSVAGEAALKIRALEAINTISFELAKAEPIQTLDDKLCLTPEQLDALVWGVGMLLAGSESDGERGQIFCEIYNLKRAGVRAAKGKISDTLPVCGG